MNHKISTYVPIYMTDADDGLSTDQMSDYAIQRSNFHQDLNMLLQSKTDTESIRRTFRKYFIPISSLHPANTPPPRDINIVPGLQAPIIDQERFDFFSFYSLALVSLRNPEDSKRFIDNEVFIFRTRISSAFESVGPDYLFTTLFNADCPLYQMVSPAFDFDTYYKKDTKKFVAPFELILPYVNMGLRSFTLQDGVITVDSKDSADLIAYFYRAYLCRLIALFRRRGITNSEPFKNIISQFDFKTGQSFTGVRSDTTAVTYADIDTVSRSFPLCMHRMYKKLRTTHKLMHDGRLQFGLYLKGIGMSLEDSMKLWREELSKVTSNFDRQYAYNIRYNYGKEGSAKNYTPYSCVGIFRQPPPGGDKVHGCPFKGSSNELKEAIKNRTHDLRDDVVAVIVAKAVASPQVACRMFFEAMYGEGAYGDEAGVTHPCTYFQAAEDVFLAKEKRGQ